MSGEIPWTPAIPTIRRDNKGKLIIWAVHRMDIEMMLTAAGLPEININKMDSVEVCAFYRIIERREETTLKLAFP